MLNGFLYFERVRLVCIGGIEEVGKVKIVIILRHFLLNNFPTVISCFKLQYFLFLFYLIFCSVLSVMHKVLIGGLHLNKLIKKIR
jgi:hypothetical protein